jgi:dihydrodipicolinate synthase/N-acetylneuraminate lyase
VSHDPIADACPNLIGFKDRIGDAEPMSIRALVGDRLAYLNGMPTAETYARAFAARGFASYSSAIFNFVPRMAMDVHRAVYSGDNCRALGVWTSNLCRMGSALRLGKQHYRTYLCLIRRMSRASSTHSSANPQDAHTYRLTFAGRLNTLFPIQM